MTAPDSSPTLADAARANDVPLMESLLQGGADLNAKDARGFSALMLAAYSGCEEAFRWLVSQGADVNSDAGGNTVLMGAAFKGHLGMVKLLVEKGADPTRRNAQGMDAHDFAAQFGQAETAAYLQSLRRP